MRTILLFLIIFVLPDEYSASEPLNFCTFNSTISGLPSTWSFATLDQVKLCFQNISVNYSVVNETMKQLFNSLDFYSFLSIVRQSNYPYSMNINFREELSNILNQSNMNTYKNDYDFHMAVTLCFKKLKDFHTTYSVPNGYAQFHVLLPFILEFLPLTKQIKVQFGINLYSSIMRSNSNMNYTNQIVTKIDGINAFDYMMNFAEKYSIMSKDPSVRLNSVFREEFWLQNLAQYPLPLKSNITFTFLDKTETVIFPYVVVITKKFDQQSSIENDNRYSPSVTYTTRNAFSYITRLEKFNWYEQKTNDKFRFITGNNDTYYYIHESTNTSIIRLGSFDDEVSEDVKRAFLAASGTTLILDVIGNRGGSSCLAYAALHFLVPEYFSHRVLYEPFDGRTTKQLQTFATIFSFSPDSILDLRNMSSFTNMEWMEPRVNYTRGNTTDQYSMKWSINCDGQAFGMGKYWMRNESNTKYFKSIHVLTDGSCGSACSLFVSKLRYASNLKNIYGIGGGYFNYDSDLFESSSYAGGGAFDWNSIVTYHNQLATYNTSIDHLPTSAYLNLNVFEVYINALNKDYPREFLKQPIDKKLDNGDYFNIDQSLEKIINDDGKSSAHSLFDHSSIKIFLFNIFVVIFLMN
ncbi:unnamed protein product [Rotaria magnacalcarata]|uniref:Tail specific protease domain-containing protein n=3 Tax=Rotaria magnacalcarata TaxID=392030 RepID=A0A816SIU5_9BILA|nr:unnamed protein product [Rotaria magnacalcarata]CAF1620438.1 unnamed protein product [Rotaria magnacalcarata]CAF2081668.1 unnamed protein product [Rotaria magnacalcarata]CAF4135674.1 unnamed protein product [Rotaria magnacalcarata]CAF4263781.1 unnamed protein product [Rotaria magnacalcarata]